MRGLIARVLALFSALFRGFGLRGVHALGAGIVGCLASSRVSPICRPTFSFADRGTRRLFIRERPGQSAPSSQFRPARARRQGPSVPGPFREAPTYNQQEMGQAA